MTPLSLSIVSHSFVCQDLAAIDKKLADLYGKIPDSFTDDQKHERVERFEKLLLKYTGELPKTKLITPIEKTVRLQPGPHISTSEDGKFRIYSIA